MVEHFMDGNNIRRDLMIEMEFENIGCTCNICGRDGGFVSKYSMYD